MKLSMFKRKISTKGETNRIRREGDVPGIIYGNKEAGEPIYLKGEEVQALLRNIKPGLLSTTIFELEDGPSKHRAILKDIQYHVTSYAVQHVDFALVSENNPVTINVPIRIVGAVDCVGVKLGGFLRQAIRMIKVRCLPKDIPQEFAIDVREMSIGQSKTLAAIEMPAGVRPLAKLNEVAIVVAKKAGA